MVIFFWSLEKRSQSDCSKTRFNVTQPHLKLMYFFKFEFDQYYIFLHITHFFLVFEEPITPIVRGPQWTTYATVNLNLNEDDDNEKHIPRNKKNVLIPKRH